MDKTFKANFLHPDIPVKVIASRYYEAKGNSNKHAFRNFKNARTLDFDLVRKIIEDFIQEVQDFQEKAFDKFPDSKPAKKYKDLVLEIDPEAICVKEEAGYYVDSQNNNLSGFKGSSNKAWEEAYSRLMTENKEINLREEIYK